MLISLNLQVNNCLSLIKDIIIAIKLIKFEDNVTIKNIYLAIYLLINGNI